MAILDRELDVHETDDVEFLGHLARSTLDLGLDLVRQAEGGNHAGGVTGVDAGLLDVLHHRTDDRSLAVTDAVDVNLGGAVEEAVDEHGTLG